MKGIITASCLTKIERFAYNYAIESGYNLKDGKLDPDWVEYKRDDGTPRKALPVSSLFNMLSGTSTGSLLSTGLSIQKNRVIKGDGIIDTEPLYFAEDAIGIYLKAADDIFNPNGLRTWGIILIILGFVLVCGVPCFICGHRRHNNPNKWKAFEDMKVFLREA